MKLMPTISLGMLCTEVGVKFVSTVKDVKTHTVEERRLENSLS